MIDPFILESLLRGPPAILEAAPTAIGTQADIVVLERETQAHIEEKGRQFEDWVCSIELAAQKSENTAGEKATPELMQKIADVVRMIDEKVLIFSALGLSAQKQNERLLRDSGSKELTSMLRRVSKIAAEQDRKMIEGFLYMSKLVRVIRYNLDPTAGSGETFSEPARLDEYLANLVL